jgi:hypothetical protein
MRTGITILGQPYIIGLPREATDMTVLAVTPQGWTANQAKYIPFALQTTQRLVSVSAFCTVSAGNFDLGLYASDGVTRLDSLGSTAVGGNNTKNTWTLTTPILLECDRIHWIAMSASTTSTWTGYTVSAVNGRLGGLAQQASAHPLPSTATPAQVTTTSWPMLAATFL